MQLLESTHHSQSALANYCRTGLYTPIKGINEKNISQYRDLIFNVVDDILQSTFSMTHELLASKEWSSLTKAFFSNHRCTSPQVWYMPKEFYEYLLDFGHPLLEKYPHVLELLCFEWLETALYMMEDIPSSYLTEGAIDSDLLVLNPESHFQYFSYPVHRKNAKLIKKIDRADYFLSIHRMPETGQLFFTDISAALFRLLQLLATRPHTLLDLTAMTCSEFGIGLTKEVLQETTNFIKQSLASKLILGFSKIES